MKYLGIQISEDGETQWRNNGGIIERRFLYNNQGWESVSGEGVPRTAEELNALCKSGGYGYRRFLKGGAQ